MSEIEDLNNIDNNVIGAGSHNAKGASSSRYPKGEQRGLCCYPATARTEWTKEMNIAVMECYFLSNSVDENGKPIRGYRRCMYSTWTERQSFHVTEQRLCDEARMIRKSGWLAELQLAVIKKRLVNASVEENEENEIYVGEETVEGNDTVNNNDPMASASILEVSSHERELIDKITSTTKMI